jgi:hypothetical protein
MSPWVTHNVAQFQDCESLDKFNVDIQIQKIFQEIL